ncbi:MAG: GTP-binding protein [Bacteroidetes bacterium MedPE-SWsnd-G2]|nr:MAG: GTP-binding protein [Bacteroidetes bacterium MedPE-SWsnd-G2]
MPTGQEIELRPRFKFELNYENQKALKAFEDSKNNQKKFVVTRIDDHVFIKLPKAEQHFWSPQLHLEIIEKDKKSSTLHGLFGPNPTVWTMFLFMHFIVAVLFIGFAIWGYSNWALDTSYSLQIALMVLMVITWFVLYFAGRLGKSSNKEEMEDLKTFMYETLPID